ncbi:MAG: 6-carboxytetrahydropterin synthase [Gammaproteobacteria bacterium]|nr:6-carboxytetrahydropterin synthase [Gammaproteobacteria bacterium]
MLRTNYLTIHKEEFSFSAGHFTIFSATEREQLHGHNYNVSIRFKMNIDHNGLAFDYRIYKKKLQAVCQQIDRHFLLPSESTYMQLFEEGDYCIGLFNGEKIPFLKKDVIILPLSNITIEELSHWFLAKMLEEVTLLKHGIVAVEVQVYNGPGQSAAAHFGTW